MGVTPDNRSVAAYAAFGRSGPHGASGWRVMGRLRSLNAGDRAQDLDAPRRQPRHVMRHSNGTVWPS